jgi:hypothetical protein
MASFSLITEGVTDQIVIEHILFGFFNDKDLVINRLQPKEDLEQQDIAVTHGNWDQVLKYCKSSDFQGAFTAFDTYIIIHIDSDVFSSEHIGKEYSLSFKHDNGSDFSVEEITEAVSKKLIEAIGEEFYIKKKERIIFAIPVGQIECWLLPLYYSNNKKSKTVNCLNTLNQELSKGKKGFTIDAKKAVYYRKATKDYLKQRILLKKGPENPSLKIFLDSLSGLGQTT